MSKSAGKPSSPGGVERRRSVRKAVLQTFQVFLVIPSCGVRKIYLKDVSEGGIGFYAEPEDKFTEGAAVDCFFYINPSLRLPLSVRVAHVMVEGAGDERRRKVGCEFTEKGSTAYRAFVGFIGLLDQLAEFVD